MKAKVIVEKNSDGLFEANMEFVKSVPFGLFGQGCTVDDTISDFYNSYKEAKFLYCKEGKAAPELTFEFFYDAASFIQHYAYAFSLAGLERITGINQKQLGHYLNGYRRPSHKTVKKIEEGVRRFSKELSAVHFI